MCFTVNVNLVKEELESRYGATFLDPENYRPSYYYHAFGFPKLPAICSSNPDTVRLLSWGLIPGWVRSEEAANEIRTKTLNARAESASEKPSFSDSFRTKRCIIPVRGFFEWQHRSKIKVPWYIERKDLDLMSIAGLYSEWISSVSGEAVSTFTILTTEANGLMADIHNSKKRMPLILERENEDLWLDLSADENRIRTLTLPYPSGILNAWTVSPLAGNVKADRNRPEVIAPYNWMPENTLF